VERVGPGHFGGEKGWHIEYVEKRSIYYFRIISGYHGVLGVADYESDIKTYN